MAAVTVNSYLDNVAGSVREVDYNVSIATSGDTLATGLQQVLTVSFNDVAITKAAASGGTVTFTTTGGAVANALVRVAGY